MILHVNNTLTLKMLCRHKRFGWMEKAIKTIFWVDHLILYRISIYFLCQNCVYATSFHCLFFSCVSVKDWIFCYCCCCCCWTNFNRFEQEHTNNWKSYKMSSHSTQVCPCGETGSRRQQIPKLFKHKYSKKEYVVIGYISSASTFNLPDLALLSQHFCNHIVVSFFVFI